ncbi:MAG: hypothetical protein GYA21_17070 [Myxococcales bacterium]|nr:hypothetical protein [Myxococcales bacterium]
MAYDRPSWREIDKMRDGGRVRKKRDNQIRDLSEHSTRYEKYKSDLNRLFDQGMASELVKKFGKDKPAAEDDARKRRRDAMRQPTADSKASLSRLKLIRAVLEAGDPAALVAAVDELSQRFGLPDEWEVLIRVLEHPGEALQEQAIDRMIALLPVSAKVPRRATLKERLRAVAQVAREAKLRDKARGLEERL